MEVTLFERENRPVCVARSLFDPHNLDPVLHYIISTGITWLWDSEELGKKGVQCQDSRISVH